MGSGKKQREVPRVFEILRSSAFIYKYYPTSTLGDNLSTSSGTWVVVKSKREVPRGVRNLRSSAFIYKYYPTSTLKDNLSTSSGTWVVVKSKREVPRGVRNSTFFGIHIQILPDKYPRGQLVHQQWHMGSGKKQKRSTEGCSKFYVLRHSYTNTTRQVPSGTTCPPAVAHG